MRKVLIVFSLLAAATLACAATGKERTAAAPRPALALDHAAPSVDALLDEFLEALADKDTASLHQLRVTKSEYQGIIVPGTVAAGQPPRTVSEQPNEFFWQLLDTKSRYSAQYLIEHFGGRRYRGRELHYSRPERQYAWYNAYGEVRLTLAGDDGETYELRTGWIAEVDGKYKFIGFEWDGDK